MVVVIILTYKILQCLMPLPYQSISSGRYSVRKIGAAAIAVPGFDEPRLRRSKAALGVGRDRHLRVNSLGTASAPKKGEQENWQQSVGREWARVEAETNTRAEEGQQVTSLQAAS